MSVGVPLACMGVAYVVTSKRNGAAGASATVLSDLEEEARRKHKHEKKRRQREQRQKRQSAVPSAYSSPASSTSEEESSEESSDVEEINNETDLLQLARLKKMANASGSASVASLASTLVQSESSVTMQAIETSEVDGEWNKVPTKHEELISNLKTKVAYLTSELENTSDAHVEQQKQLEHSNKRSQVLEGEMRERTKAYQATLAKAEAEISSLRVELNEAVAKIESVTELQGEITDLQSKFTLMQEELAKSEETYQALFKERQDLSVALDAFKQECVVAKSEAGTLQRQLAEAQRSSESFSLELQAAKKALQLEQVKAGEVEESMSTELIILRTKCEALERDVSKLEVEAQKGEGAKDELKAKCEQLQAAEKSNASVQDATNAQITALKEQVNSLTADKKKLTAEATALKSQSSMMPSDYYCYLDTLMCAQKSFLSEKSILLGQIIDLKRRLPAESSNN